MRIRLAIASITFFAALAPAQTNPAPFIQYQDEIRANPANSLAHYRMGELYFRDKNYLSAANEFREALNGDLRPGWIEPWSHIQLGNLFGISGQAERAANEYRLAARAEPYQWSPAQGLPKILDTPAPEYSEEAKLAGLEGTVVLSVAVSADGRAGEIKVEAPLGLGLDERAIESVRGCRFEPATRDGSAVAGQAMVSVDFLLPTKVSRWHLLRAQFETPEGAIPARLVDARYPAGIGVSVAGIDEGRLIGAIGRQGTATISFDVDEEGTPGHFQVKSASLDLWGNEAISLLRDWRFRPGIKDGRAVAVPCTVDLAWGPRHLTTKSLEWARTSLRGMQKRPALSAGDPILVLTASDGAYTEEARRARIEGVVTLELLIGNDGTVRDTYVLQPLGYGLDEKAMQMVREAHFPASLSNVLPEAPPNTAKVIFHMKGPAWGARD